MARPAPVLASEVLELPDSLEAVEAHFRAQGWTDGLPIVPPTEGRVQAMLAGIDAEPDHVVGKVPPLWAEATVEKVAINTVMAGAPPETMPVVVAANEDGNPTYLQQYGSLRDVAGRVWDGSVAPTGLVSTSFRGIEVLLQYPFASARKPMVQFRVDHLRQSEGGWFRPGDEEHCMLLTDADWERHLGRLKKPKPLYFRDDSRPARILRTAHHAIRACKSQPAFGVVGRFLQPVGEPRDHPLDHRCALGGQRADDESQGRHRRDCAGRQRRVQRASTRRGASLRAPSASRLIPRCASASTSP